MDKLLYLKAVIFIVSLIYASYIDIKTMTIPNGVHITILIAGLINISVAPAFLGLVVTALPFFITAMITDGGIGGGDVKLMGACGFVLGATMGILAAIIALSAQIIWYVIRKLQGKANKEQVYPLAPFLALGSITAYLIKGVII